MDRGVAGLFASDSLDPGVVYVDPGGAEWGCVCEWERRRGGRCAWTAGQRGCWPPALDPGVVDVRPGERRETQDSKIKFSSHFHFFSSEIPPLKSGGVAG